MVFYAVTHNQQLILYQFRVHYSTLNFKVNTFNKTFLKIIFRSAIDILPCGGYLLLLATAHLIVAF